MGSNYASAYLTLNGRALSAMIKDGACGRRLITFNISTQSAITYSKLTIETLEQGVKYV